MMRATPFARSALDLSRCVADLATRAATIHGPGRYDMTTAEHPVFGRFWVISGNGHRFLATNDSDAATLRAALELVREIAGR